MDKELKHRLLRGYTSKVHNHWIRIHMTPLNIPRQPYPHSPVQKLIHMPPMSPHRPHSSVQQSPMHVTCELWRSTHRGYILQKEQHCSRAKRKRGPLFLIDRGATSRLQFTGRTTCTLYSKLVCTLTSPAAPSMTTQAFILLQPCTQETGTYISQVIGGHLVDHQLD